MTWVLLVVLAVAGHEAFWTRSCRPAWWRGFWLGWLGGFVVEHHIMLRDYVSWSHAEFYLVEGRTGATLFLVLLSCILHAFSCAGAGWFARRIHLELLDDGPAGAP